MPSPFPGMDPWIEDPEIWGDFHGHLASDIGARLNAAISPRYVARLVPVAVHGAPRCLYGIEVRRSESMELVTAIEILSPIRKRRDELYASRAKERRELLRAYVNLLEISLVRCGERPALSQRLPPAPYAVVLSRPGPRRSVGAWPIRLQDELPVVPVPLLHPDRAVPLDLAAAIRCVYERGAYASQIDYGRPPPPPPLSEEEADWVEERLRENGL
jgi:hypothetical protein